MIDQPTPKTKAPRRWSWSWIVFLLGAVAMLIWNTAAKIDHIRSISNVGAEGANHAARAVSSDQVKPELTPNNSLLLPDQLNASYDWLAQTERMLNRGELRVRHIDYENAPFGRSVLASSPYRWWLGFLAWCEHIITGRPASAVVEKAALWADPIILGILILGAVLLTAKYFGSLSAALVSIGLISLYPFVTGFLPAEPDDRGLAELWAIASVLFLAIGIASAEENATCRQRWFIFAGIAGGLGLWVKVPVQLPVLVGIVLGGFFAASCRPRPTAQSLSLPWRAWSYAGAATVIVAALLDYNWSDLRLGELSYIHPLHGFAWIGAAELLARWHAWRQTKTLSRGAKDIGAIILSIAAVAIVPIALVKRHGSGLFGIDGMGSHLTRLSDGIVAKNLAAWVGLQGPSIWLLLTFAPLVILFSVFWILLENRLAASIRPAIALSLGPVLIGLAIAVVKLSGWQMLDGLLLVTLAVSAAAIAPKEISAKLRLGWIAVVMLGLAPGLIYTVGWGRPNRGADVTQTELHDLILRDLANWVGQHSGSGAVTILAPPSASTALCYYGNFRGLGAVSEENQEGIAAVIRIMSSRSVAETKEVMSRRGITHIVLLSWDAFFDDCARAAGPVEGTFRDQLKFTTLPLWLRPRAYPLPSIPGFEDQSVIVFEVVDDQDEATALSNIALYFLETGNLEQARSAAEGLSHFPIDVGAWVARAQVAAAVGDDEELGKALKVLEARLGARVQPLISWDRRVDLAVVLARAKSGTLAKKELEICVATLDETKLRSLSPGSVYRLLVMCRGFEVSMPAAERDLALSLVPPALRSRLE